MVTKAKPKRTEREQDFLDMAAIHLMAAAIQTTRAKNVEELAANCFDGAEALLAKRTKRL
jgi:hypothetical protein